jgi:hypothetical protein
MVYGFDGQSRTPSEVARLCGKSLDDVDEIATKIVRRMRHPVCAKLIREELAAADERVWSALGGRHGILYKAESLVTAGARLPGELRFGIECLYGGVENWLAANTRVTTRAWYRSRFSAAEIDGLILRLTSGADEILLPWPLETLAGAMEADAEALETAVRLSGACRMYAGYVAAMPLGTRAPRAVRLHRMLCGEHGGKLMPAGPLAEAYRSRFADDACTRGDAERAMGSYPHLFLRVHESGWGAVGHAGCRVSAPEGSNEDEVTFHRWGEDRKSGTEAGLREVIRQILKEHGPLRLSQIEDLIRKRSIEILPSSIPAYLNAGDEFVRLAPGIHGLSEHVGDLDFTTSAKLLLRRGACMQYVYARWAGEPADAYPLWTAKMEAEWCEWVQWEDKNLLGSLLAVVDPAGWPVDDAYREAWLWKKECLGAFQLEEPPRYPLGDVRLIDVLALVKAARSRGSANWLLANRVRGAITLLDRGAVSSMALVIGLGAVVAAPHWQRAHAVSPCADEIDGLVSEELHFRGVLEWNGEAGSELLDRVDATVERDETGWVLPGELRGLCERLRGAGG